MPEREGPPAVARRGSLRSVWSEAYAEAPAFVRWWMRRFFLKDIMINEFIIHFFTFFSINIILLFYRLFIFSTLFDRK